MPFKIANIPNCMYDALHFQTGKKTKEKLKACLFLNIILPHALTKIWCSHYFKSGAYLQEFSVLQPKLQAFLLQKKKKSLKNLLVATCMVMDTLNPVTIIYECFFSVL